MNTFYANLLDSVQQGKDITLVTAVDCLVEFSDSYDMLIAQKAFQADDALVAQTPSMDQFWRSVLSAQPAAIPDLFFQDTWWAFFDPMSNPFPEGTLEKLAAEESMILATVVAKAESNSELSGRKMLLDNAGTVYGSLGSAGAEAAVLEVAEAVQQEGYPRLVEYTPEEEDAQTIRILVEPVN